jgi:thiamine-phosphate pyrophosphorylase
MLFVKPEDRIIDVNLNRLTEGLRVIEDIGRFKVENKAIVNTIRKLKQKIWQNMGETRQKVILSRESKEDIGRKPEFDRIKRHSLNEILTANIKRSQESARVLEEIFKLKDEQTSGLFKSIRFSLYDMEKELVKRSKPAFDLRLYVIIDIASLRSKYLAGITKACVSGGATMIQLREPKHTLSRQWLLDAIKIKKAISNQKVKLIINDRVDIVQAADADGVHLGVHDMPITFARKILGNEKIIGISTQNIIQAKNAAKYDADYIGVGAIFPTTTKLDAPLIGINKLKTIVKEVKIPVVAIGGITAQNAKQLFNIRVSGIAVASSVFKDVDFKHTGFNKTIIKNLKKFC